MQDGRGVMRSHSEPVIKDAGAERHAITNLRRIMDPYCFTWGGEYGKEHDGNTNRQEPCVALRQASSGCQGRGGAPTGLALGGAGLRAIPLGPLTPLLRKAECILQKLNCSQSLEENTGEHGIAEGCVKKLHIRAMHVTLTLWYFKGLGEQPPFQFHKSCRIRKGTEILAASDVGNRLNLLEEGKGSGHVGKVKAPATLFPLLPVVLSAADKSSRSFISISFPQSLHQCSRSKLHHRAAIARPLCGPCRRLPGVFSVALAARCLQAGEGVAWREIHPGTGQEASGGRFTVALWLLAAGRRCRWARFSLMADPPRAPER
ncbi:unnamed protein product [Arctogadus glacialis]